MLMMPRLIGVCGFASMSILSTLAFTPNSPAMSSTMGAIMRQGEHHSAQKSTRTGSADFRTDCSNSASVTDPTCDIAGQDTSYLAAGLAEGDVFAASLAGLLSEVGPDLDSPFDSPLVPLFVSLPEL